MKRVPILLPLLAVLALSAIVSVALFEPADRTMRSNLVDKPAPEIVLPAILPDKPGLARGDGAGGMRVINVFGSWCAPCIAEAPQLLRLKAAGVAVDAVATDDTAAGVREFLKRYGDPYARIGDDKDGKAKIALGSSGVPETFVVDARGRIIRQYFSNLQPGQADEIIALWRARK